VFCHSKDTLLYARVDVEDEGVRVGDLRSIELAEDCFHSGQLGGPARDTAVFEASVRSLVAEIDNGGEPIGEASLVLPDQWCRLVFAEGDQMPSATAAREEALRWKLKRLVPFRIDELRINAVPASPLSGQEGDERVMIGFAIDLLVSQVEKAFDLVGIQLGQIANVSLSIANLVEPLPEDEVGVIVVAQDDGYSLLASVGESPVLYRYKDLATTDGAAAGSVIDREMRMTAGFLAERLEGRGVGRVVVVGEGDWPSIVAEALEVQPDVLDSSLFVPPHSGAASVAPTIRAAMVGAAHQVTA